MLLRPRSRLVPLQTAPGAEQRQGVAVLREGAGASPRGYTVRRAALRAAEHLPGQGPQLLVQTHVAEAMRAGEQPGDPERERLGVFTLVTRRQNFDARVKKSVIGLDR